MNRKLLLCAGSVVFALLVCEAAGLWVLPIQYRLSQTHGSRDQNSSFSASIHVPDPEIGWVLTPGTIKSRPFPTTARQARANVAYSISHGERLTSSEAQLGPVIIATGCSFTFGQAVNDENTWPWLLQDNLLDYHVVNVAAMGYGTDQALLAAEREASRFPGKVSAVVLGFGDFQIDRNRSTERWLSTLYPLGKPWFVRKGDEVESQGLLKFWSFGSTIDKILDSSTLMSRVVNLSFDQIHRIEGHDGGRRLTVSLIRSFARRFQSRGIKLVVVVLPYKWDYVPQSQQDRRFVVDQLTATGIPTMVMNIPRLPNGRIDTDQFMVGTHPNREYDLMLANQVTQFLSAQAGLGIKPSLSRDERVAHQKSTEVSENTDGKLHSN